MNKDTINFYAALPPDFLCECAYCRNYMKHARRTFPSLAAYLDGIGVPIEKPFEAIPMDAAPGRVQYLGVQYVVMGEEADFRDWRQDGVHVPLADSHPDTGLDEPHYVIKAGFQDGTMNLDPEVLIPRDKHDTDRLELLEGFTDEQIAPVIPALLTWLQDINWPVAPEVARILSRRQALVEPYIVRVLQPTETDEIWKYWLLSSLIPQFQHPVGEELRLAMERIIESPTEGEIEEEVRQAAKEYLEG